MACVARHSHNTVHTTPTSTNPCSFQAASEGPRATEQFAAIAAAFVSCLAAGLQAQELGATFLAELADRQDEAYRKKDT